jgi:hypothetical protein
MTGSRGVLVGVTVGLAVGVGVQQASPAVALGVLRAVAVRLGAAGDVGGASVAVRVSVATAVGVAVPGLPSSSPSPHPTASASSTTNHAAERQCVIIHPSTRH